jgi:D-alanyl-D-alanine carboxypeptidase (penicillin-binding protein 5/6)
MSRRLLAIFAVVFCFAWTAVGAVVLWPASDGGGDGGDSAAGREAARGAAVEGISGLEGAREEVTGGGAAVAVPEGRVEAEPIEDGLEGAPPGPGTGEFAVLPAQPPYVVQPRLKMPPSAGMLFDVDSGEVLWARNPGTERPIASLTKMMTALVISERHGPSEQVLVTPKAAGVEGSRIGVLRPGRKVPLRGLFLGLLMVSGNDAAAALAEHDAGTIPAFVRRMNEKALGMDLGCTRFAGPAGLQDTGNRSCAYDLAAMARASLADPWIASITSRRYAQVPFPMKGGTLELANNHFFVQRGIAGVPKAVVTGVKTGLTNGAGRCYVTTARLGDRHLGVVLLDSQEPLRQVPQLLRAGFAAAG